MKNGIIYLDLDGVICNMIGGVAKLFNRNYTELIRSWTPGVYQIENILGISRNEFYSALEGNEDFWSNLEPFPYMMDLYEHCLKIAPTFLLTKPTLDPASLSGKLKWIHKHFGNNFDNYIMTRYKFHCAAKDRVLVDDYDKNIVEFREKNGNGILFPTITNNRFALKGNCLEVVKEELETFRNRL